MTESSKLKTKKVEILFGDEEEEYLEEDNYFKIDGKNTFSIGDSEDSKDKLYTILNDNDDFLINNIELQKKIIFLFYEKIYKTDPDPFDICHNISKHLMKSLDIQKSIVEEKLNYFIIKKRDYKYSKIFEFNKENLYYLGYILAYSYNKLSSFKINNGKDLKINTDKTKEEKIDVLTLFYDYCIEANLSQQETSKILVWKKKCNNLHLPGTFIFLINTFIYINTIDINFNFEEEKLTKDDVNLFIISILNIPYIFPSKITIKINLIHEELQCSVYRRFYKELFRYTHVGYFKMIYMNKDDVYKKKWDFETEFLLEKHRRNRKGDIDRIFNSETLVEDNNSLLSNNYSYRSTNKDTIFNNTSNNSNSRANFQNPYFFKSQKIKYNNTIVINDDNNNMNNVNASKNSSLIKNFLSSKTLIYNRINSSKMVNNPNENFENLHYENIIQNFKKSIGLILLTIDSLSNFTNMKRLDLIINDCYKSELQYYLKNFCFQEVSHKFHIVDILINRVKNLDELNLELNILDHITFNKILSFINYNLSLTSIKLSFFSSDATYLKQTIYKIYYQNIGGPREVSISKILDLILPHFIENLDVLFELIKIKDLKKIEVNFDTPCLIEINNPYMNTIFKFLMNLLFLVDNRNTRIEKLVILSPSTKFDRRFLPSIENILEDINFNENNEFLTELSLHLQLFMLKNIKNLITKRLVSLNIGDCDVYTFRELTKFLTSYKFSQKSELKKLSISLINSIIEYTSVIKNNFYKIFSIKLKKLSELNVYTNLYINKDTYLDLIDIFKYNWISKCRLLLHPRSDIDNIIIQNNKIIHLVPHNLENQLLSNDELVIRNKIFDENQKKINSEDNLYWILIQVFIKKNKKDRINIKYKKKTIFNILEYLYFTKPVEIFHQLDS